MSSSGASLLVKNLINQYKLLVIEKQSCPYCTLLRRILSKYELRNGTTHVLNIEGRSDTEDIQSYLRSVTKVTTVPQVFIAGEFVGGALEMKKLDETGKLRNLFLKHIIVK